MLYNEGSIFFVIFPDRLAAGLKILALPTVVRIHFRENKTRQVSTCLVLFLQIIRVYQMVQIANCRQYAIVDYQRDWEKYPRKFERILKLFKFWWKSFKTYWYKFQNSMIIHSQTNWYFFDKLFVDMCLIIKFQYLIIVRHDNII